MRLSFLGPSISFFLCLSVRGFLILKTLNSALWRVAHRQTLDVKRHHRCYLRQNIFDNANFGSNHFSKKNRLNLVCSTLKQKNAFSQIWRARLANVLFLWQLGVDWETFTNYRPYYVAVVVVAPTWRMKQLFHISMLLLLMLSILLLLLLL